MVGKHGADTDDDAVPTIQELVGRAIDRGTNPTQIAKAMGRPGRQQIYELRDGKVAAFPKASTFEPLARALDVDVTTLVLAFAATLGIPVRRRGPKVGNLLPTGADELSDRQIDAVVAVIKAMLPAAETPADVVPMKRKAPPPEPARRAARRPSTPRQRDVDR